MLKRRLRSLASWVRHLPDRRAHGRRRDATRAALVEHPPSHVLVLCLGNICRSPYAAERLRARLTGRVDGRVRVSSGGFLESGRPAPANARSVASTRGVDLEPHRSRMVSEELIRDADLVVVMEQVQVQRFRQRFPGHRRRMVVLGDLDPERIRKRTILDPINRSEAVFEEVYARIDRCVDALADAVSEGWRRRGV